MSQTIGRIEREGRISFGDASLSVWEEGIAAARAAGGYQAQRAWEHQFKCDVFARIVQTMNRCGWTCIIPPEMIKQYGISFARDRRYCRKGDLQADLEISGRCIELKMFQNVNAPDRADNGGRYQDNKERHMPYVMRLEMERARRRIRTYLTNVFTGYAHETKSLSICRKPLERTAEECIREHYADSWHFKGDLTNYTISDYNRTSADGDMLHHGQRVYFFDWHGRLCTGTALYNINNMWWVITGRYDYRNEASCVLYTKCPDKPRVKRNADLRRRRLEGELSKAVKVMNFERATVLRDILFPRKPALFTVWHTGHQLYHRSGFRGYARDLVDAGRFTADEVRGWDVAPNKVVSMDAREVA